MTFFFSVAHFHAAWCSGVGQVGKKDHNLPPLLRTDVWGDLFVIQTLHEITR